MSTFTHHPDDHIHIDELYLPLSFFLTQEPLYDLETPFIHREYIQLDRHVLSDGSTQEGSDLPWTEGDAYIAKKSIYADAYDEFLNPPPTVEEAREIKLSELSDFASEIRNGKVVFDGNIYFSTDEQLERIRNEYEQFSRDMPPLLPGGYYVNDHNYDEVSFTLLADLIDLIDKILELWYLVDLNEDFHRGEINDLVSVESIEAYSFASGWPITPYV